MNQLTPGARNGFLEGGWRWVTDNVWKAQLVDAALEFDPATMVNLADLDGAMLLGSPVTIGTRTAIAGVADAADVVVTDADAGFTFGGVLVYRTGGTTPLVAWIDTLESDLPINGVTTGGNVTLRWSSTLGVFKL